MLCMIFGLRILLLRRFSPQSRFANIGIAEGTVPSTATLTSDQVKMAIAQHYDVGIGEFEDHFVEMNPTVTLLYGQIRALVHR